MTVDVFPAGAGGSTAVAESTEEEDSHQEQAAQTRSREKYDSTVIRFAQMVQRWDSDFEKKSKKRNNCLTVSGLSVGRKLVFPTHMNWCFCFAEQLEMFMKGQGEAIIEDDDKGEDPDVVVDNPGEIICRTLFPLQYW